MLLVLVVAVAACGGVFIYQATRVRFSSTLATNLVRVVMVAIGIWLIVAAVAVFRDPL